MATSSFAPVGAEILPGLYTHRLLSREQIQVLYTPTNQVRWVQRVLAELTAAGLVAAVRTRARPSMNLYFLTAAGLETVEATPRVETRRVQVTPEGAAGMLQAHTLAVNNVGIAFVKEARARDDECGPLAWRHEVPHAIGPGAGRGAKGGDLVIADALLRYTQYGSGSGVSLRDRFVELDRATEPVEDLVAKLRRYARLYSYSPADVNGGARLPDDVVPGWRQTYPNAFPWVLLVFAGKPRHVLERRMRTVLAYAARDEAISAVTPGDGRPGGLVVLCALLEDLVASGPFAPIFARHDYPGEHVNWLGAA